MLKKFVVLFLSMLILAGIGSSAWASNRIDRLREKALQGDAVAQYILGREYRRGKRVPMSYKKAVKWFYAASDNGNLDARYILGEAFITGDDLLIRNVPSGLKLLKSAAAQGHINSQKELVQFYLSNINGYKEEAVKWFHTAAEQGQVSVQVALGEMYGAGRVVTKNEQEAVKWFRKAAEQGDDTAQNHLGVAYSAGLGVPQDDQKAVVWFQKSAEQGNAISMSTLGVMHAEGRGVPQDFEQAVVWFKKAATHGYNSKDRRILGLMYFNGKGVPQDYSEAMKWFKKAADYGDVESQRLLGLMYFEGHGIPKDYSEAVKWFEKAAVKKDAVAAYLYGIAYYKGGYGITQNNTLAANAFATAAKAGHAGAQLALGNMLYSGEKIPQDYKSAATLFKWAADQGVEEAQFRLSVIYSKGHGVDKDYVSARKWLGLAVTASNGRKELVEALKALEKEMTPTQIAEAQKLADAWKPTRKAK